MTSLYKVQRNPCVGGKHKSAIKDKRRMAEELQLRSQIAFPSPKVYKSPLCEAVIPGSAVIIPNTYTHYNNLLPPTCQYCHGRFPLFYFFLKRL